MTASQYKETLLIVDDDEDFLNILCEHLQEDGRRILRSPNGVSALKNYLNPEFQRNNHIDIILSDMNMPEITGLDLFLTYKAEGVQGQFICMSGFSDRIKVFLAMKYGVYDFIEKPYQLKDLKVLISEGIRVGKRRLKKEEIIPEWRAFVDFHRPELNDLVANEFRLSDPLSILPYLRALYHWIFSMKTHAFAAGFFELARCMEEFRTSILFLRSFSELLEPDYLAAILSCLGTCTEIFSGAARERKVEELIIKNHDLLREINEKMFVKAFT